MLFKRYRHLSLIDRLWGIGNQVIIHWWICILPFRFILNAVTDQVTGSYVAGKMRMLRHMYRLYARANQHWRSASAAAFTQRWLDASITTTHERRQCERALNYRVLRNVRVQWLEYVQSPSDNVVNKVIKYIWTVQIFKNIFTLIITKRSKDKILLW